MFKNAIGAVAALSLAVVPTMASAATNPAAPRSISSNVRTGTASAHKSNLSGGGTAIALLIVAGIVAIGVIAATKDDDVSTPVSR